MNIQYITDSSGQKNSVVLHLSDWKQIQKELDELEKLRNKLAFVEGLKEAFSEVDRIKKREKKANSLQDLFDELQDSADR